MCIYHPPWLPSDIWFLAWAASKPEHWTFPKPHLSTNTLPSSVQWWAICCLSRWCVICRACWGLLSNHQIAIPRLHTHPHLPPSGMESMWMTPFQKLITEPCNQIRCCYVVWTSGNIQDRPDYESEEDWYALYYRLGTTPQWMGLIQEICKKYAEHW